MAEKTKFDVFDYQHSILSEDNNLTPNEKYIALAFLRYTQNGDSTCYPSIAMISKDTGFSERAVQNNVRRLKGKKYLRCVENSKGGRGKAPRYELLKGADGDTLYDSERVQMDALKGAAQDVKGADGDTHIRKEETIEETKKKPIWSPPDWWNPMLVLNEYVIANYQGSVKSISEACDYAGVDPALVIKAFVADWPMLKLPKAQGGYGKKDPVQVLVRNINLQISKAKRDRSPPQSNNNRPSNIYHEELNEHGQSIKHLAEAERLAARERNIHSPP